MAEEAARALADKLDRDLLNRYIVPDDLGPTDEQIRKMIRVLDEQPVLSTQVAPHDEPTDAELYDMGAYHGAFQSRYSLERLCYILSFPDGSTTRTANELDRLREEPLWIDSDFRRVFS